MTALMMLQPKSAARMMTAALMPPRRMRLVMLSLAVIIETSMPQTRARNTAPATISTMRMPRSMTATRTGAIGLPSVPGSGGLST